MGESLSYEVVIVVRPDLVAAWEAYLPGHVADVLATGCFISGEIERGGPGEYRCRYTVANPALLDCYLAEHAARLRADAAEKFPEGVDASRAVWSRWRRLEP